MERIFSTNVGPPEHSDYVDLVPIGAVDKHRERLKEQIRRLVPAEGTPLALCAQDPPGLRLGYPPDVALLDGLEAQPSEEHLRRPVERQDRELERIDSELLGPRDDRESEQAPLACARDRRKRMTPRQVAITVDCPDAPHLAAFWERFLGYTRRPAARDHRARRRRPGRTSVRDLSDRSGTEGGKGSTAP